MNKTSLKTLKMTESVIREMTRYSHEVDATNLAQGFPDFPPPQRVVDLAAQKLRGEFNQYSITWGAKSFRDAVANYYKHWYDITVYPEEELTICCGSTEAMLSTVMATVNPGERIIIFEPFYENYLPDAILCDAEPAFVQLEEREGIWEIPWETLEKTARAGFKAIIINTPNNPTGKVFSKEELLRIGDLCERHDALLISDEIYDHIIFDGKRHIPPASIPELRSRTVTINSLSKTFAVTGWRVGWAFAPPEITDAIRKVHDFTTVGAPHPLQEAGAEMLAFEDEYFNGLSPFYQERRDFLAEGLKMAGFRPIIPEGAYYMLAEYNPDSTVKTDMEYCYMLAREAGIATVPGSSFYKSMGPRTGLLRFCFGKKMKTLETVVNFLRSATLR